jgi:subtilisin family serine protease
VNLSLGGDFGAHDGTSKLERELSKFVGPNHPGRSIVVAAGNSGSLYHSNQLGYPNPFGIHAVAQVPSESTSRLPILIAASADPTWASQLYIWVASRPGDHLKVGLESENGIWIAPVDLLDSSQKIDSSGKYTATIQNGVTESDQPSTVDHAGAAIVIAGPFERDRILSLRFEGHGSASVWVQAAGGIDPALNGIGAILPGAQREGTISVPATSPNLIAVGATLNHVDWEDIDGTKNLASRYVANYFLRNEVLPFSSAGPTAVDVLKPDLVAPGGYVAGAMSSLADPRSESGAKAMFAGDATKCYSGSSDCLLVDEQHALSTGTSMASPIVAGAVAQLFQRNPSLKQNEILGALQAGASSVYGLYASPSQVGAGLLDVENALLALEGTASEAELSTNHSWIGLAISYVRPDPDWPVAGLVHLRDAANRAVDIDVTRLSLRVHNGRVVSDLSREAAGYYRFRIAGADRTAGQHLSVELLLDGVHVLKVQRDIAVDMPNTDEAAVAGRGCSVVGSAHNRAGRALLVMLLGIAVTRWRRAQRMPC